MGIAIHVQPTLDDLHAIQVAAVWIFQSCQQESRSFAFWSLTQVATHGHTFGISAYTGPAGLCISLFKIPAAEKPDGHARPGGGIDLLALHGIEDCLTRVLCGPDCCIAGGYLLPAVPPDVSHLTY